MPTTTLVAIMTSVPMPMVPIDEDGVGSTGVGDEVGWTLNIELIVPPSALFRSNVSVPLKLTTKKVAVCMSSCFVIEAEYVYCG